MRLKFYSEENLKKQILEIVGRYLDLTSHKIFFFGSRVSGKGGERSDIDVGIDGPREVPFEAMAQIKEDIENLPTLYKIDIVDFKKVNPQFRRIALKSTDIFS